MVFVNYKNPIRIKIHELSKMEHEPFAVDKKGMADITEKFANSKNMTDKKKILEHLKYAHNFTATQIENFISNIYFYKGPFAEKKNVFKLFSEYEQSLKEAEQLFAEHREAPAGNFFFSPGNIVEKGFNETGKLARNCDSFAAELKRELRIHFKSLLFDCNRANFRKLEKCIGHCNLLGIDKSTICQVAVEAITDHGRTPKAHDSRKKAKAAAAIDSAEESIDVYTKIQFLVGENNSAALLGQRKLTLESAVNKHLVALIEAGDLKAVERLFKLCYENSSKEAFVKRVSEFVLERAALLFSASDSIDALLALEKLATRILKRTRRDRTLEAGIKQSMKAAIDRNVDKCVGFLIKFVEESIAREDAAQTIGEMVPLFRLLSHKSEFEFAYSASLAFRLMGAPAESPRASEVERRVLGVLKAECGANYVARLNDMLDEFFCKPSQQVFGVKSFLRLKVFGRKIWPACSDAAVDVGSVLPQLAEQIRAMCSEKSAKLENKVVAWSPGNDRCRLKVALKKGKVELAVDATQACVLCLFNEYEQISYSSIKETLRVDDENLKRGLASLCQSSEGKKESILAKIPGGGSVKSDDVFRFNSALEDEKSLSVPRTIGVKPNKKAVLGKLRTGLEKDNIIDSRIISLLKDRGEIKQSDLLERFGPTEFAVQQSHLESRVRYLLEREFISAEKGVLRYML